MSLLSSLLRREFFLDWRYVPGARKESAWARSCPVRDESKTNCGRSTFWRNGGYALHMRCHRRRQGGATHSESSGPSSFLLKYLNEENFNLFTNNKPKMCFSAGGSK